MTVALPRRPAGGSSGRGYTAFTVLTVAVALLCVAGVVAVPRVPAVDWAVPVAGLAGLWAVAWIPRAAVPLIAASGVCLSVFSGNWGYIGLPIGPDRFVVLLAVAVAVRDALRTGEQIVRFRPLLWVILALLAWTAMSAALAGTLLQHEGLFSLIDSQGVMPAVVFAFAPLLFPDERSRTTLLRALTVLGGYLAYVSVAEGFDAKAIIFPSFITDASIGHHAYRARGPFAEAAANGLALAMCAACAGVLVARQVERRWVRVAAGVVVVGCLAGTLFALTRAVWVGVVVAVVVCSVITPATRRLGLVAIPVMALGVVLAIATVPGLSGDVQNRTESSRPVDDRKNIARAALLAVQEHPLLGTGWQTFADVGNEYVRQAETYPITSVHIPVHNVPLGRAAETGLPGATLWAVTYLGVTLWPLRRRRQLQSTWGLALLACSIVYFTSAMLNPLGFAFPTLLLWLLGSLVTRDGDEHTAAAMTDGPVAELAPA